MLLLIIGAVSTSSSQILSPLYQEGFKAGVEVGEYYRGMVLAAHPEYSITYDIKYYEINPLKPGGLDSSTGTYNYTQGYAMVYFITADPNSQIRNLYTDPNIIAQGDFLQDQYFADTSDDYKKGLWQGYNARMSGKVGGLQ